MRTITINIPDEKDYSLLLQLLQRLGIKQSVEPANDSSKKMAASLKKLAASGGIKSIENPVEWQKQIRKDRNLR